MKSSNDRDAGAGKHPLISLDDLAKHGIHRTSPKPFRKLKARNVLIGVMAVGGTTAATVGAIAAGTSATGAISVTGAAVGGVAGGVMGSSVGLATGGIGMAATVPFAAAGTAIGSWAGPALALVGIGTAPVWAIPLAIGGTVVAVGSVVATLIGWRNQEDRTQMPKPVSTRDALKRAPYL